MLPPALPLGHMTTSFIHHTHTPTQHDTAANHNAMTAIPNLDVVDLLLPNVTVSVNLIASRVQDGARKSKKAVAVRTIGDPIPKKRPKRRPKLPKETTLLPLKVMLRKHRQKEKKQQPWWPNPNLNPSITPCRTKITWP